ncbi:MAG: SIMPL domain-containing protein [Rubellimicrobium sp.]|nr:SIMPL domain-containing protein [Rubellimicrobium sp.]
MSRMPTVVLALAVLAAPALAQESPLRTITVSGEGAAVVVPDQAIVSIGVSRTAADPGSALAEMSEAMTAVLARLAEAGVAATDIRTSELGLSPLYDYNNDFGDGPRLLGFQASTMVSVRLGDLDLVGPVLDVTVRDGANSVGGLVLSVADEAPLLDIARRDAVRDALERAALYADAAGVGLGEVLSISEVFRHDGPMPHMMIAMEADGARVPIAAGESRIAASVTMVLAIAD